MSDEKIQKNVQPDPRERQETPLMKERKLIETSEKQKLENEKVQIPKS